uniref:Uncharacterized protein n=1 Tax=Chromera velia CCMP2878 TaxID=1169474 RepID=A0A0K6SB39_9ALVE|eukprot:Cvel_13213.t1-p1 / transcript=Cvel_13213.t1 / gene=Cvel_13213 / organism=Chromera_velia_CCMP2878 / gene_product=hypothetical protein / transcript_product=hypothetical protein / location=Cvel_scaffold894:39529-42793(-) / protein_length=377 / sequence_SO=supercontig / SO=protein_coding / is_pseudo=false
MPLVPLADEGEEVECTLRAGRNFHKTPVVDSGASRHFFGRDVSSCIVEVREEERELVRVEGGISCSFKDITVELPGVETVDGGEETTRLDGSFSQLNASPDLAEFGGTAAAPANDVNRFSDFSFDDDGEVDINAMGGANPVAVLSSSRAQATFFDGVSTAAVHQLEHVVGSQPTSVSAPFSLPPQGVAGSRLPAGQLEARAQQQGVESEREEAKQSGWDAAPAAESEEIEREEKIVLPDIPDDDSLFGMNLLKSDSGTAAAGLLARESGPTSSREEKEVQVAQEDEGVQKAQEDERKREKEKKEKEKRVTRLSVDKKVIDVMMVHVNPRKGYVMATEEEVRNGSHDGAMREELKSFKRNEVLKVGGVRVPARRRDPR